MADSCHVCQKTSAEVSLKKCGACSSTQYCSRDCQKADWKVHRQVCRKQPSPSNNTNPASPCHLSPPQGLDAPVENPFTRLDENTWLHGRSEIDVYRLLIDAYRLRAEDDYVLEGEYQPLSIYSGASNGLRGFTRFLGRVASRGLLPPWWTPEKAKACKQLGMSASGWSDLRCAVEKSDIIEHYGDPRFPMQLRMFAESALGRGPGGSDGTVLRRTLKAIEQGSGNRMDVIDTTTMNVSRY